MTCASCVARVEKKLNRLEGVEASVNLATASARVSFDPSLVDEDTLVETVERTGYTAALPSGRGARRGDRRRRRTPAACCAGCCSPHP